MSGHGLACLLAAAAIACAPPASFRPVHAPHATSSELGVGGAVVGPRPFVDEPSEGAVQAWWGRRLGRRFTLSVLSAFDEDALAAGVGVAFVPVRTARFATGLAIEGGFAWGAASVPVALRLSGDAWLYGAPRVGNWGDQWTPALPVGVALPLGSRVELRAEVAPTWAGFSANHRRIIGGAALVYRFGRASSK